MAEEERVSTSESSDISSDNLEVSSESESFTESSDESDEILSENTGKKRKVNTNSSKGKSAKKPAVASTSRDSRSKKKATTSLNKKEIEELAEWVFSNEEAQKVEDKVRTELSEMERIALYPTRKRFAEHLTSKQQEQNLKLIVFGFCRKFSTLTQEVYRKSVNSDRKATFSCLWMKVMGNFQVGKASQERIILDRCTADMVEDISIEDVHCVVSVIHELVYHNIHDNIRIKKESKQSTIAEAVTIMAEESDDTLFRYCGAALHRMVKLRQETLKGKTSRAKPSTKRGAVMEMELQLLNSLILRDKSNISTHLKNLDEGNLTFPKHELIPFLRSVDNEVREFTTDNNLKKFPSKFVGMCQTSVINNERLENDFSVVVSSLVKSEFGQDKSLVDGIFNSLVSKLANTRINEFLNAKAERDLKAQNKVVDADEMLRPKLKSYALVSRRTSHK